LASIYFGVLDRSMALSSSSAKLFPSKAADATAVNFGCSKGMRTRGRVGPFRIAASVAKLTSQETQQMQLDRQPGIRSPLPWSKSSLRPGLSNSLYSNAVRTIGLQMRRIEEVKLEARSSLAGSEHYTALNGPPNYQSFA
jgi:hypothetical protein